MNHRQSQENAQESLKKDFGQEGYQTLMEGVDEIIKLSKQFNMPYSQIVQTMKEADQGGDTFIRREGDNWVAYRKSEKEEDK